MLERSHCTLADDQLGNMVPPHPELNPHTGRLGSHHHYMQLSPMLCLSSSAANMLRIHLARST
jgi:hypothetical protein